MRSNQLTETHARLDEARGVARMLADPGVCAVRQRMERDVRDAVLAAPVDGLIVAQATMRAVVALFAQLDDSASRVRSLEAEIARQSETRPALDARPGNWGN